MGAANEEEELKAAFKACGPNKDGHLDFDHFYALLKSGNELFMEEEAHELFRAADRDLSGDIDFVEFVDFLYGHKDVGGQKKGSLRASVEHFHDVELETRAKQKVLTRSVTLRNEASRAVREAGGDWKKLRWEQRLHAISNIEHGRPVLEELDHTFESVDERPAPAAEEKAVRSTSKNSEAATSIPEKVPDEKKVDKKPAARRYSSSPLEGKTQAQMVDYSLHKYDLCFAENEAGNLELTRLKEDLKTAGGPPPQLEFVKYLAKGTQGWVFLGQWSTGEKAAVKAIRMTQALGGVKEWYISKLCRKANIEKIVYTLPTVYVIVRSEAQPVIEERLRDAGPVEHYVCLVQDFMNGGTLEALVESPDFTPLKMFTALEDVAQTLASMHANNITHRDIKPENVLLEVIGDSIKAKLCDLGSAELGNKPAGRADDIRRFGVMMFSLATGEGWTKNRLLHETHDHLIARLTEAVGKLDDPVMKKLPFVLEKILNGKHSMAEVANIMTELRSSC